MSPATKPRGNSEDKLFTPESSDKKVSLFVPENSIEIMSPDQTGKSNKKKNKKGKKWSKFNTKINTSIFKEYNFKISVSSDKYKLYLLLSDFD